MNAQVASILRDIERLIDLHRNPDIKRALVLRIQAACEALLGQERAPDNGPWVVTDEGQRLVSGDFTHDVALTLIGDFYGDADRAAYAQRLAKQLNGLPKDPPPALIESMCLRYAHDFGIDADDTSPIASGWTEEEREGLRRTMRQLYEEVAGHGFYRWP